MRISRNMAEEVGKEVYELDGKHSQMKKFSYLAAYRNNNDWDTFMAVTGDKGTGKSNYAIQQARVYVDVMKEKHNIDVDFDPVENIVYSSTKKEIFDKVNNTQNKGVIIFDEAARFILGEDWNSKESKASKKMWGEIRTKNLFVIFVLPFNFTSIDSKYRRSLINFWVDCIFRGSGLIFEKTRNGFFAKKLYNECYVGFVKWSDGVNKKSRKKWINKIENAIYNNAGISNSYQGTITWNKMPKSIEQIYYKHRDEKVYEEKEEEEKEEFVTKGRLEKQKEIRSKLINIMINDLGVRQKDIAKKMGVTSSTISHWKIDVEES